MPAIDGIVSGLNTTEIINSIIDVQSIPKLRMEQRNRELNDRMESLSSLKGKMTTLLASLKALDTPGEFRVKSATAGDNNAMFTTSLGTLAASAEYSVSVEQLAQGQTSYSQGFSSTTANDTIEEGLYGVSIGTDSYSFTIGPTNSSLEDFVEEFNENVTGAKASLIYNQASDEYSLVVKSSETGADQAFSISVAGPAGTGAPITWTEGTAAQNAEITFDGVPLQSSSNTFTNLVTGLSLTVKAAGLATSLTVADDSSSIKSKINTIVSAYNDMLSYYGGQTVYDKEKALIGSLVGESTSRRAIQDLGNLVTGSYAVGGALTGLSEIGISTNRDGTLSVDDAALSEALEDNFSDVEKLFTNSSGPIQTLKDHLNDLYLDRYSGAFATTIGSIEDQIKENEDQIEKMQTRLDQYTERLRAQFAALEGTLGSLQQTQSSLNAAFSGLLQGQG